MSTDYPEDIIAALRLSLKQRDAAYDQACKERDEARKEATEWRNANNYGMAGADYERPTLEEYRKLHPLPWEESVKEATPNLQGTVTSSTKILKG